MAEGCDIFIHWRVCYDHIFRRSDSGFQPLPLFFFIIRRGIQKEKANKNILSEKNKTQHTTDKDIIMLSGFDFGEHRSTLAGQSRTPTLAGFF